jgi:hypothetical protein
MTRQKTRFDIIAELRLKKQSNQWDPYVDQRALATELKHFIQAVPPYCKMQHKYRQLVLAEWAEYVEWTNV